MATKVHMEALSPTMEEGQLVRWLKNEGDAVEEGDVLAEIETDKATMELVARGSGVLKGIQIAEGQTAAVGSVIAFIAAEGEETPAGGAAAEAPAEKTPAAKAPAAEAPAAKQPAAKPAAGSERRSHVDTQRSAETLAAEQSGEAFTRPDGGTGAEAAGTATAAAGGAAGAEPA